MPSEELIPARAPVAIVGAGPTGLSLALGLARHGVRSVVFEKNESTSRDSKAPGVHIRTREVFRQWGIEERFLDRGVLESHLAVRRARDGRPLFAVDFDLLDEEAYKPGILIIEQPVTEHILLEAVKESGLCKVRFGREAVGVVQGEEGAVLTVRGDQEERSLHADFVVGCDGASSFVRNALKLPFDGITYAMQPMLADVRMEGCDDIPSPWMQNRGSGLIVAIRLRQGFWRIIQLDVGRASSDEEVADSEVQRSVERVLKKEAADIVWASRFRIHRRSVPRFRVGRVLLAGDAAHLHSPVGGQGMNAGIQDAHNLAWKLAGALRGGNADCLLDSYDVERREVVVGSVTRYTDIVTRIFLQSPAPIRAAAFFALRLSLNIPAVHRRAIRRASMVDLGYSHSPILPGDMADAGRRLPNARLRSPESAPVRLYDLLPIGPSLLTIAPRDGAADRMAVEPDTLPVSTVIPVGQGSYLDPAGAIHDLTGRKRGWILVRPDAHIAWVGDSLDKMEGAFRYAIEGHRKGP